MRALTALDARTRPSRARVAIAVALWGCAPSPSGPVVQPLVVTVMEGDGEGVAGARIWAGGDELGESDGSGSVRANLRGLVGETVRLNVACPAGFSTREGRRRLTLRATAVGSTPSALQVRVTCRRLAQPAAVVVLARGPGSHGLGVRVHGEVVARTDVDGVAHLALEAAPGATLRVQLDTSEEPTLRPRSPVRSFKIGDEPSLALFEQRFEQAPAPPRPRRPPPRSRDRPPLTVAPYRLR